MADITPTQAIVRSGRVREIVLGADTTVFGQLLYFDPTLGSWQLATAAQTMRESIVKYMALEIALKDATIRVLDAGGVVDLGAVLSQGLPYYLSPTVGAAAGRISNDYADLLSTHYVTTLGIAQSASELMFYVLNSRTTIP